LPENLHQDKRGMATGDDTLLSMQMDELRHRLRNHLQNMISLISLQIRRAQGPETIAALEDLRARFATLTSIYIDLDNSSDRTLPLDSFVPDLVRRIGELYDPAGAYESVVQVVPITLEGQRAAILGQIVVELVMNVYRHAFDARTSGRVSVDVMRDQDDIVLTISDDGPGLREPDQKRRHYGFTIVTGLAKGLGGAFEYESANGLTTRVRFPADSSAA
jgi:two-component sensor histidine kinase